MAYGTTAQVTLLLGGIDTTSFTAANITTAITMSDVVVDIINSGASDDNKTLASSIVASNFLKSGRVTSKLKGLSSDGGTQGRPGVSGNPLMEFATPDVYLILKSQPRQPKFSVNQPNVSGQV